MVRYRTLEPNGTGVKMMEIYRFKKLNIMGFEMEEEFFLEKEKAVKHYKEKLNDYRSSDLRTKTEDLAQLDKQFRRHKAIIPSDRRIEHFIEVWERVSHEYDEWDTTVESIVLDTISVIQ